MHYARSDNINDNYMSMYLRGIPYRVLDMLNAKRQRATKDLEQSILRNQMVTA